MAELSVDLERELSGARPTAGAPGLPLVAGLAAQVLRDHGLINLFHADNAWMAVETQVE
jgi:hypothetical protein